MRHWLQNSPLYILLIRGALLAIRLLLVLYIGKYLGLRDLGVYGLLNGAVALTPVFVSMGMVHLVMRDTVSHDIRDSVRSLRIYWSYIAFVYAVGIAFVCILYIYGYISQLVLICSFICFLEHVGNDFFHLFINTRRPILANVTAFFRGGVWVILYVPLSSIFEIFRSVEWLFIFWFAGDVLALLLASWSVRHWPWRESLQQRLDFRSYLEVWRRSRLLFVSDLTHLAAQYLDRYIVSFYLGLELAGVYFFFWTIGNAVNTLVTLGFVQVQRPKLIAASVEDTKYKTREFVGLVRKYCKENLIITTVLTTVVGFIFETLVPYVHKPEVLPYIGAFWLIMIASGLRTLADFGAMAQFAASADVEMTASNAASLALFLLLGIAFTPVLGIYGAGLAVFCTFSLVGSWRFWRLGLGLSAAY
jgi:O-antigen/teichoic acid export membrane protein